MGFSRFVEGGRGVLINFGPDAGKLATIIDVVDGRRVLIDGPQSITEVARQVINLKRISLTDVKVENLSVGCKVTKLEVEWEEQGILEKWEESAWSKKLMRRKTRASTSDFERFKVMIAKGQKAKLVAAQVK